MTIAQERIQKEEKEENKKKLKSILLTIQALLLVFLFLFFFGFSYLDPPPPEEGGIAVSMGQEDAGFENETPQQAAEQQTASTPETEESFETQDYEDAEEQKSTPPSTPVTTPPKPNPKKEEPKKEVNSDLLFKQGDKSTNNGSGGKNGNQGAENGTGDDPLGKGIGSDGTGWYMGGGRKPETKIKASCDFARNETVVVKIKVDRNGNVTSTDCVIKYKDFNATTVGNPYCDCAKDAAKAVKFTSKSDAPSTQEGAVKFEFRVK